MGAADAKEKASPVEVRPRSPYGAIFPVGLERVLARWSASGPVAYFEAEHIAKPEAETATVWRHGEVVSEPTKAIHST